MSLRKNGYIYNIDNNTFIDKNEKIFTFSELINEEWLSTLINNVEVYYKKENKTKIEIKNSLRIEFERAIKKYIKDFMPVDTVCWKILYEGI